MEEGSNRSIFIEISKVELTKPIFFFFVFFDGVVWDSNHCATVGITHAITSEFPTSAKASFNVMVRYLILPLPLTYCRWSLHKDKPIKLMILKIMRCYNSFNSQQWHQDPGIIVNCRLLIHKVRQNIPIIYSDSYKTLEINKIPTKI